MFLLPSPHSPTGLLAHQEHPVKWIYTRFRVIKTLTPYLDLIVLIIINGRNRTKTLIGSDPHKIIIPINKPQFENALQTSTDFQIAFTHGKEQADKLVSFAILEEQHALLHNNAGSLHQLWKIPYRQAKEIISNCSTCRPLHLRPIAQGINPRSLQPNELRQMDVTHCPELSPFFFLHVCINTNSSFIWATPLHGEATHVITHLLTCFAVSGTPSSIKWRRQWHPTPVFLPGESQGRGSLVGCRLWGRTESDTTEAT